MIDEPCAAEEQNPLVVEVDQDAKTIAFVGKGDTVTEIKDVTPKEPTPEPRKLPSEDPMLEPRSRRLAVARMFLGGKTIADIARCWNLSPESIERLMRTVLKVRP